MKHSIDARAIDVLEPRALLAAYASVGIVQGPDSLGRPTAQVFATEGFRENDGASSGSVFGHGSSDRQFEGDLYYDSVRELLDGRFTRDDDRGYYGNPIEQNGARYIADHGYPVGWYFADYGSTEEVEVLLQVPAFTPDEDDFEGSYRYCLVGMDTAKNESYASAGRLSIGSDIDYSSSVGKLPYDGSFITGVTPGGALVSARDEYFYLSASGKSLIFADMATSDGALQIGVAVREAAPPTFQEMAGRFLVAWGVLDGKGIDFSQLVLDLETDGDYKFYDLDDFDSGNAEVIERGFWSLSGSTVVLDRDKSTDEIRLIIGESGNLLVASQATSDGTVRPIFCAATRVQEIPGGDEVYFTAQAVENSRPKVYQLESDQEWYRTDLASLGGPTITGAYRSWVDPKDGRAYAAAVTASGLILYTQNDDTTWSIRNLTTELGGSTRIATELCVMTGPTGTIHLTGINPAGDLVRYYQTGGVVASGGYAWGYENITDQSLEPAGLTTPAFSGLISFATSWNALNIAGLDSQGDVIAVWWAPGMTAWTVNNLSEEYGSDPLAGGLNVWLTSWNAINIGGVASDGSLKVTWWVPQHGSTWLQSNLTDIIGGPLLESASLASFVSSWGAMNVAGVERGTGRIVVYWWSPQISDQMWKVQDMTAALPAGTPAITAPLQGVASPDNSLNVIGMSGTHLYRYYWRPDLGTSWHGQDLTAVAVDR